MRLYLLLAVLFVSCAQPIAQHKNKDDLKSKVIQFYALLYGEKTVSVAQAIDLFGSVEVEEEHLFFEKCEENGTAEDCEIEFNLCMNNKESCESQLFKHILTNKEKLTYSRSYEELASLLRESEFDEKNSVVALAFKEGERVYFRIAVNDNNEIILGDIYLSDKQSVFNSLSDWPKNSLVIEEE